VPHHTRSARCSPTLAKSAPATGHRHRTSTVDASMRIVSLQPSATGIPSQPGRARTLWGVTGECGYPPGRAAVTRPVVLAARGLNCVPRRPLIGCFVGEGAPPAITLRDSYGVAYMVISGQLTAAVDPGPPGK